jgi:hypothetical protein
LDPSFLFFLSLAAVSLILFVFILVFLLSRMRKAVTLCIGSPEIGTVTLFRDRLDQVRPYLPSDRQASLK